MLARLLFCRGSGIRDRNSGEIESVFDYYYAKQTQFPKKSNERKSI